MSEVQDLESKWAAMMAARYDVGHRLAGQRIYEVDGKYAREVTALAVQIAERKAAEASRPQINQQQLEWLNRVQGAADANGRRPAQEISQKATALRKNLDNARRLVFEGKPLPQSVIDATEAEFANQGVTMPTLVLRPTTTHRDMDGNMVGNTVLMPSAVDVAAPLPQAINTNRGPK